MKFRLFLFWSPAQPSEPLLNLLSTPKSSSFWHRVGRKFNCTPQGLNPWPSKLLSSQGRFYYRASTSRVKIRVSNIIKLIFRPALVAQFLILKGTFSIWFERASNMWFWGWFFEKKINLQFRGFSKAFGARSSLRPDLVPTTLHN